ncbi:hypothetical protein [Methylibium rhizosphaerae]|uniref:hypothetical protein n=1 Tax=Methylibium rhizosphaerae TaxID=2570323 RepID=UPI00112A3C1C|nr:hypothetical protein [Methylibium rhizosphaerae]
MTREQLEQRLQAYLDAEVRILQSQEYTIGDGGTARRNKRAELATVQAEIARLQTQLARADAAVRPRILYVR